MPNARQACGFLALAILPLAGLLACANRGMQAPSIDSFVGTGSDDGGDAGLDGAAGVGGDGGAAGGTGGAGGMNAGGAAGLASAGGAAGGNVGGGAGRTNSGGAGGQTNTGGAGGANAGGIGGQTNTGGAGGVSGGGRGGSTTGGVGGTNSGGVGGATGGIGGATGGVGGASSGGAGGQTLPPLFAYYPFDQPAGPTIPDASGNGHGGTLAGTATFPTAIIGNGLSLPGVSGDYVALPGALLQTVTNVTISLWVNVRADQAWQRVFDFGSSTNVYMFLTPHAGGTSIARFAISTSGNTTEQRLDATSVLPLGAWTHVAIVLGAGGGTLYINGTVVGTNAALTLRPSDLGAAANNWIGRSQFPADPSFNGQIDELRIYASELTAGQITTIYNSR